MRKHLNKIKCSDMKKRKKNTDILKLILQLQKASSKSIWPSSTIVPGNMGFLRFHAPGTNTLNFLSSIY